MNVIEGKIIMSDNSYFYFELQDLEYLSISLDWSRRNPLMVTISAGGKVNSGTEVGNNGSLLAQQSHFSRGNPFFKSCLLDDVSVGRTGYKSTSKLFLNDLNHRQPLFILDGKKLNAEEIETMEIPTTDIFSVIKLTKKTAHQKYPSEHTEDWVYEITTQSNFQKSPYEGERHVFKSMDFSYEKPLPPGFEPALYFVNDIQFKVPEGHRFPLELKDLEEMDSVIYLNGVLGSEMFGKKGKSGVFQIYTTEEFPKEKIKADKINFTAENGLTCLLYTSPSPRDATLSRMPSSA